MRTTSHVQGTHTVTSHTVLAKLPLQGGGTLGCPSWKKRNVRTTQKMPRVHTNECDRVASCRTRRKMCTETDTRIAIEKCIRPRCSQGSTRKITHVHTCIHIYAGCMSSVVASRSSTTSCQPGWFHPHICIVCTLCQRQQERDKRCCLAPPRSLTLLSVPPCDKVRCARERYISGKLTYIQE